MGLIWKKQIGFSPKIIGIAKTKKLLVKCGNESVVALVANGMVGKKAKKVMQFASILHLFQQGHAMIEYEPLMFLFEFLALPKNNKKTLKWQLQLYDGIIHALRSNENKQGYNGGYSICCF